MTEIKKEAIDSAIREIECSGLCGNQMHKETLETALAALYRTAEHDKAMEEGRLVELPCRVGDTVYLTTRGFVEETKVRTFFVGHPSYNRGEPDLGIEMVRLTNFDVPLRAFGKTVFPTSQEAEAALHGGDDGG